MRLLSRGDTIINTITIGISLLVWVLLLVNPRGFMTLEHCTEVICGLPEETFQQVLATNFPSQLMGWVLMVVAMMLPKLISPIRAIYTQSFSNYRLVCILLFVFGYLTVWIGAGMLMIIAIVGLNFLMPMSYIPALGLFIVLLLWEFSPMKQRFLNLGHQHQVLPAFGWAALNGSFRYGLTHGKWCVCSGWALMLFPMLLPIGHHMAMLIVTFIMISEHMEHPRIPQWRISFRLKLLKIIVAQVQIRWRQLS